MRFTDRIHIDQPAAHAEGQLFVDPAFDVLKDHFPGNPLLPGLVMLEAAVRTASALLAGDPAATTAAWLSSVERLQVVRRVVPGETLIVTTDLIERTADGAAAAFRAEGRVGGDAVMRARFSLRTTTA